MVTYLWHVVDLLIILLVVILKTGRLLQLSEIICLSIGKTNDSMIDSLFLDSLIELSLRHNDYLKKMFDYISIIILNVTNFKSSLEKNMMKNYGEKLAKTHICLN